MVVTLITELIDVEASIHDGTGVHDRPNVKMVFTDDNDETYSFTFDCADRDAQDVIMRKISAAFSGELFMRDMDFPGDESICNNCSGSGEGRNEGDICRECNGKGEVLCLTK